MAKEHHDGREEEGSCRWTCLSIYAGADSQQYLDHQETQLSFDRQPHPVSPIAYAARNVSAAPKSDNRISWLNKDPFGTIAIGHHDRRSRAASIPRQTQHRSWYSQIPHNSPQRQGGLEKRHTQTPSWFSQDLPGATRRSTSSNFSNFKRPFTSRSRPSIGAPTDFRRVVDPLTEPTPVQRRSLRPLELSIYVESNGRLSPLPDFSSDEWGLTIPGLTKPPFALLRRETVDNSELASAFSVPRKPLSSSDGHDARREVMSEPCFVMSSENGPGPLIDNGIVETELPVSDLGAVDDDRTPTLPASQMDNMAMAASRSLNHGSTGYSTRFTQPSPIHFKHSRNQSSGRSSKNSFRRSKDDEAVEEAINELNTIVEAKRIQAKMDSLASPPLSPTSHIPAVAPAMTVRARSQTLSDIGSAFSTSLAAPLPARSNPGVSTACVPARGLASTQRLESTDELTSLADLSVIALPQQPSQRTLQSPKPRGSLKSTQIRTQPYRKDRLSTWLRRMSNTSADVTSTMNTNVPEFKEIGGRFETHVRSSASLDTITTIQSNESADVACSTPATTVAPSSPLGSATRSSMSNAPHDVRRMTKRGLSIDTTLSNRSRTVPPAYHELDPHPTNLVNGEVTPSRIGVAC